MQVEAVESFNRSNMFGDHWMDYTIEGKPIHIHQYGPLLVFVDWSLSSQVCTTPIYVSQQNCLNTNVFLS